MALSVPGATITSKMKRSGKIKLLWNRHLRMMIQFSFAYEQQLPGLLFYT